MNKRCIGKQKEELAAEFLKDRGMMIWEKNFACKIGEIDLIAKDRKCLVFVEVKLRKSANFAAAREYVDRRKQNKIRTTATMYLADNPTRLPCRFDVIEIYAPEGMETVRPEIYHMEDAFQ